MLRHPFLLRSEIENLWVPRPTPSNRQLIQTWNVFYTSYLDVSRLDFCFYFYTRTWFDVLPTPHKRRIISFVTNNVRENMNIWKLVYRCSGLEDASISWMTTVHIPICFGTFFCNSFLVSRIDTILVELKRKNKNIISFLFWVVNSLKNGKQNHWMLRWT